MKTSLFKLVIVFGVLVLILPAIVDSSGGIANAGFGTPKVLSGTPDRGLRDITFYGDYAICRSNKGLVVLRMHSGDSSEFVYELILGTPLQSHLEIHFRAKIAGTLAYVPDWSDDLWIVDITDPTLPTIVGGSAIVIDPDSCRSVAVRGNYAYVGTNGRYSGSGLVTLDVSDPYAPFIVGRHPVQLDACDLVLTDNHLYAAGLHVYSYSLAQPDSPVLIDENSSTGSAYAVKALEDLLVVADVSTPSGTCGALAVLSRSDTAAPVFLGREPPVPDFEAHSDLDVWAWPSRAIVLSQEGLLHVVDISNPYSPQRVYSYDTYTPCNEGLTVKGEFLYVVGQSAGVHAYRIVNRGDCNADGALSSSDVIWLVNYIFRSGPPPTPLEQGDCNCDGEFTSSDLIYLVNFIFKGGPPPFC